MAGIKRMRRIQVGKETTAGTEVNATSKWLGNGVMMDESPVTFIDADVGNMIQPNENYFPYAETSMVFDETPVTFEQLPIILSAGIEDVTTATTDGGTGTGRIYQYDYSTTAVASTKSWTIEMGNNQEEDVMVYGFVEEFTIAGASKEALTVTANWRGRGIDDTTFTTGQTAPSTFDVADFNATKFFIDDNTVGTTSVSSTLIGFEFTTDTGLRALHSADNRADFSTVLNVGPTISGNLVMLHNATGEAERAKAQAGTVRYVRLRTNGAALGTVGAAYTYKTLKIDWALVYTETPSVEDQDGNDILTFPFRGVDDLDPQIIVVNELANI